jgi:hypothetical protein
MVFQSGFSEEDAFSFNQPDKAKQGFTVAPTWGYQTSQISVNTKLKICRNQTELGFYR